MNQFAKSILSAALVAGLFSALPTVDSAHAGGANGDYERGQHCKQLRRSGALEWYSIASGTINTGGGRNGYGGFVTKACHTNEASCRRWVKRIWREIPNLDTVDANYCKRVRR
jgi:hypothetical protein